MVKHDTMQEKLNVLFDLEEGLNHERAVLKNLRYAHNAIQFQIDMCMGRINAIKFSQCELSKKNAP